MTNAVPGRRRFGLLLVVLLLVGLPVAVWLDLSAISQSALRRQAADLDAAITGIREFYAGDVVARVLAAHGHATVTDRYDAIPGGIPLPATFSLELGRVVGANQRAITYRFVSDYPFRHRAPHVLDDFERGALASLRAQPLQPLIVHTTLNGVTTQVRTIAPIIMQPSCVACHDTHPDSPKRDWKVGDVRGIQELIVAQPIASNLFSFRFLLAYFVLAALTGIWFLTQERRARNVLAAVSAKIARYVSPQISHSIFSGTTDTAIHTKRKKLTIFFSDLKDFTATSERLQPEELTMLLNEYFAEMSEVALAHGGTIDKFVGDAMLVFFGDPQSKGVEADAQAAVRMALAMQRRVAALNAQWRARGVEEPFHVRMGINTGYCNVGNFGSHARMDYTIIGAEVNLAARLQSIAEPGGLVIAYETFALARELVAAHPLAPLRVKGIPREIVPYAVDGPRDAESATLFTEHGPGVDLYLDVDALTDAEVSRTRALLRDALEALDRRPR